MHAGGPVRVGLGVRRWRSLLKASGPARPRRLNGEPLRYGAPDAWLPDLMVCRPEYADIVLAVTTQLDYRPYW